MEGASQVIRFAQTREKGPQNDAAKELLTDEVNAVVQGIRDIIPDASIHVWDGHGSGGLVPDHLLDIHYIPPQKVHMPRYFREHTIEALAFVGQHAMSYTLAGNLCHTMSSRNVEYYALNGELVGEFGLRAAIVGELGVPTIFISGDDKACNEAKCLIPEIVTVPVKKGTGWESANCFPIKETHDRLRKGIQSALERCEQIPPYKVLPPIALEIVNKSWFHINNWLKKGAIRTGVKSVMFQAESMEALVDAQVL